jgi:parvulin-like peptidyl-prolyl isomerase
MRRPLYLFLTFAVVLALAGCGGSSDTASLQADDVAVAGGTPVTKEQFQSLMARAQKSYVANKRAFPKPGSTEYEQLKGQAVVFLIQRAELSQEADDLGIDISDSKVDAKIEQLKKQYYGGSEQRYLSALKQQGLTEDQAKDEIRVQLVSEALYNKITKDVKVTDSEIKSYYDTHKSQYQQPQSRDVRHILVQKKALADQLYSQLKSGGNFAALAKKYSKDPGSAANGGKLTVSKGQTVPEFDKTTFQLKTGQLSQPIKTQYGYHIIQALSAIKPATKTPLAKVKATIRQLLSKQQKDEAMTKWVADIKKKYCDSRIKYQVGYEPNPDPCSSAASTTSQ